MTQGKHRKNTRTFSKSLAIALTVLAATALALAYGAGWIGEIPQTEGYGLSRAATNEFIQQSIEETNALKTAIEKQWEEESLQTQKATEAEVQAEGEAKAPAEAKAKTEGKAEAPAEAKAETEGEAEAKKQAVENGLHDYSSTLTPAILLEGIAQTHDLTSFSLVKQREAPEIPQSTHDALIGACKAIEDAGYTCGFVFIDLYAARGFTYNSAEPLYTASSFKAPLSFYLIESGQAQDWERNNIEASILYSDNEAFEALASPHIDQAYQTWLEEHGIAYDDWSPWYPTCATKGIAACWLDIFHFIQTDDPDAGWFGELLSNTNISFIRNALEINEDVSSEEDEDAQHAPSEGQNEQIHIWNKGGWLSDPEYNAVADCGIIQEGNRFYLMAILSNQPSWGETQERVQNLARALWEHRSVLK